MREIEKSRFAASNEPEEIYSFIELVKKIAVLSFDNKDSLLFYRGQKEDHKNQKNNSTFYPSIYRTINENLTKELLDLRFKKLEQASALLINRLESDKEKYGTSLKEIKNRKYIRWSILQHYEVCDTPLLDITQSIRVACSFALLNGAEFGYFYVFALPYVTNRISINSEHDLVNIRLINICPPQALRPYFQEGFLVGTDDITTVYDERTDLDFKQRLIAKFKLIDMHNSFWAEDGSLEKYLYREDDDFKTLCDSIRDEVADEFNIELMFSGKWRNDYILSDGRTGSEIFEIRNINEYHVGNHHIFNLDSIVINKEKQLMEFRKVGVGNDKRKAFNSVQIISPDQYVGIEDYNTRITYSKIE